MRYIKTLIIALLFTIVMPLSQAAVEDATMVYDQEQVDSIVAEKVEKAVKAVVARQVDGELIDLKIDKAASEKLDAVLTLQDTLQAEHDSLISHELTLIAIIFTVLAGIIGIFIPWKMNGKIEIKLEENTKELEKSKNELEQNKDELGEYERKLEDSIKESEKSKSEIKAMEAKIIEIRSEVEQWKQAAETFKMEAEKAARRSKFSELLSRAWNEKDFNKQIEMATDLIDKYPESEFASQSYYARGTYFMNNKDNNKAILDLSEAIRLNKDFSEAYNNRGVSYYNINQYPEAISDYTQAMKLNPNDALAYYNRGLVFSILKQTKEAIQDFTEAIRLNPNYVKAYNERCDVYRKTGELNLALEDAKLGNEIAKKQGRLDLVEQFEKKIKEIEEEIEKQNNNTEVLLFS